MPPVRATIFAAAAALTASVLLLPACGDDETTRPADRVRDYSVPDSVLAALVDAYNTRDCDLYAELLGYDFTFVFQEVDVTWEIPSGTWNMTEDSTGTCRLFSSADVDEIRLAMTWEPPVAMTVDGKSALLLAATVGILDVDERNGVTLRLVGDRQDFYLRLGEADHGEDPARYYLMRWEDLGHSGFGKPGVEPTTWGEIKSMFE